MQWLRSGLLLLGLLAVVSHACSSSLRSHRLRRPAHRAAPPRGVSPRRPRWIRSPAQPPAGARSAGAAAGRAATGAGGRAGARRTAPRRGPPPPPGQVGETEPGDNGIVMNFQDVDLDQLVKFISEITGRNFILDDRVKGKVTIISPGKITVDEAYAVFNRCCR